MTIFEAAFTAVVATTELLLSYNTSFVCVHLHANKLHLSFILLINISCKRSLLSFTMKWFKRQNLTQIPVIIVAGL